MTSVRRRSSAFLAWVTLAVSVTFGGEAQGATAFTIQNRPVGEFAGWAATGGVRVITGDFNGDGATDIGLVRQAAGWATVPVALATATGFTIQNRPAADFAAWAATPGVRVITGDFNGDGATDIALVRQTAGWTTVPVALSSASGFTIQNRPVGAFAGWAATGGVRVITGDWNGDGRTDIGLVRQTAGWTTVPVALSSATGFTIQNRPAGDFAVWARTSGVRVITGDFNNDNRMDIGLVRQTAGWATVPVALSSATAFTIQNRPVGAFAGWAATSGVQVVTGNFGGDAGTDIALVRQAAGWTTVPVALSSATGFTIQNRPVGAFAGWAATSGVQVVTGNFGGDGGTDIGLVRQTAGWATVPVALSSATAFALQNRPVGAFAGWAATSGVRVVTGNFGGDAFSDIGLVRQTAGWSTVPVALTSDGGVVHNLQVRRFSSANMTAAIADTILADATTVLQTNDGPGDVACDVTLVRDGAVTVFATGDGSLDSSAEFNAVIGLPGHIKLVNQINWCGGLIPNVIGCAPVPGNSLAVVRFTPNQEGILWAHEFGHNCSLSHRTDATAVMNGTIGTTHRRVNAAECDAYRAHEVTAAASSEGAPQPMNVKDFVRQVFIHGVPYDQASQYDASVVPTLLEMLSDPEEQAHWANVVVVLGMIGHDSAVEPLIAFIESDADEAGLSREHYAAKTSSLMALGYLINKSGNQRALDYLIAGLDPQSWAARDVAGTAPFQESVAERNRDLSKHAILGLAVSGRPEAAEALRTLQQPAETEAQSDFQAEVGDLVTEALREHQKVSTQGLTEYYRKPKP